MNQVDPKVITYVTEEVWRQGHDVEAFDGISRVRNMLDAWCYALHFSKVRKPRMHDALDMGRMIEPTKVEGIRTVGVRVGYRLCPPPERLEESLSDLFKQREQFDPMQFYREFEMIHPFVDGNGRTGKILLNWLNETLLDPIFPPQDFWGRPIRNP